MQKRTKCPHGKFKWNCEDCGGLKRCEMHKRVARTCRICYPKFWAQRILSRHRQDARRLGYAPPNITAKKLLKLLEKSPNCCGCDAPLDYQASGFNAPCLHHNHETGEVVGFAHRECNSLEGQLQKLGVRLPIFLKNFFPQVNT
jgi:Recombination endonuclease VII